MLNKIDLELFEILDSEIDKTLSEGCIFISDFTKIYRKIYGGNIEYNDGHNYYINGFDMIKIDTIIGHYPTTNTVLKYISSKLNIHDIKIEDGYIKIGFGILQYFFLDIAKEIKDYTNEQKQELINFFKNI